MKEINVSALSLELVWKGNPLFWAGEVRAIDLFLGNGQQYSASLTELLPNNQEQSLMLKNSKDIYPVTAPIQYLTITDLDTTQFIRLRAGVFTKKKGNAVIQQPDGSFKPDYYYKREDIPFNLYLTSVNFELGKHYKIVVNNEKDLAAILVEDGLYRKNVVKPLMIEPKASPFLSRKVLIEGIIGFSAIIGGCIAESVLYGSANHIGLGFALAGAMIVMTAVISLLNMYQKHAIDPYIKRMQTSDSEQSTKTPLVLSPNKPSSMTPESSSTTKNNLTARVLSAVRPLQCKPGFFN